jgi:pyruvate,water dikinase
LGLRRRAQLALSGLARHVLNSYGANVLASIIAQTSQAVGDVDSASQSFELWELSRKVNSSPMVNAAFDEGVDGLLGRLRASNAPDATRFLEDWHAFIGRWGLVGPTVWEFRSPTYRTHPEIALRVLDRARQTPDSSAPGVRAERLIAERETAIAEIADRLAGNADAQGQFIGARTGHPCGSVGSRRDTAHQGWHDRDRRRQHRHGHRALSRQAGDSD